MIELLKSRRFLIGLFVGLFAASQPPVIHRLVAPTDLWVLGVPFLYAYLFAIYAAQITVLIVAARTEP